MGQNVVVPQKCPGPQIALSRYKKTCLLRTDSGKNHIIIDLIVFLGENDAKIIVLGNSQLQ